ncbi:MAG TPA: hypothetical protein VFI92_10735 [Steroidobacteraceae bacterium]|nr:hypothetical protein [Steroidobacteraceae bacterium]
MPHSIHWEPDGVCVKFTGTVTADEIVRIYEAMSGDPRSDRLKYVLTDYLGANRCTSMTLTDVKGFAALEHGASYVAGAPVWRAAVATDPSICDFLKYFKAVRTSPDPFEIFSTQREAREWLNMHPRLRRKLQSGKGC